MKKIIAILTIAAAAVLGMSLASCTKLEPTEITTEELPYTAHAKFTFTSSTVAISQGSVAVFTITSAGKTYVVRKPVGNGGVVEVECGCTATGATIVGSLQVSAPTLEGTKWYYGSGAASLEASNKYYKAVTVTIN